MLIRNAPPKAMWDGRAGTLAFFVLAVLVAASVGVLLAAKPAHASTIMVNSMADAFDLSSQDGVCATEPFVVGTKPKCTLRAAIGEANVNGESDTIVFGSGLSGTIILTLGELRINDDTATDDLSIQGPGASTISVSGNNASRVLFIADNASATINGLTISNGKTATNSGGGGIYNFGTLKLSNTTVSDNFATDGGGIANDPGGEVQLTNTTVSGNRSVRGGGISGSGTVKLSNTTVSDNIANEFGGGIFTGGTLTLANTTVSDNFANEFGGGIAKVDGEVTLTNTIVARNTAPTGPDASGTFSSQGNNLIGNITGASGFVASDLLNVNPLLGQLQDNGGPTFTHALLPGSPAVDAGTNTGCPATDQRGVARKDGDNNGSIICDIGAYERSDLKSPKVSSTTPASGATGVKRNANLTATFSEKMTRSTLDTSTFKLFKVKSDGSTTQITSVTVSSSTDGLQATLNPFGTSSTLLGANTKYKAIVTTGATDLAGNQLDQSSTTNGKQQKAWTFTTGTS